MGEGSPLSTPGEQPLTVDCWPIDDGWQCRVEVGPAPHSTTHEVIVSLETLDRLTPPDVDAAALVRESFRFLLEREPRQAILREFALTEISRYFPEYEAEIKRRL